MTSRRLSGPPLLLCARGCAKSFKLMDSFNLKEDRQCGRHCGSPLLQMRTLRPKEQKSLAQGQSLLDTKIRGLVGLGRRGLFLPGGPYVMCRGLSSIHQPNRPLTYHPGSHRVKTSHTCEDPILKLLIGMPVLTSLKDKDQTTCLPINMLGAWKVVTITPGLHQAWPASHSCLLRA